MSKTDEQLEQEFSAKLREARQALVEAQRIALELDGREQEVSGGKSGDWYSIGSNLDTLDAVGQGMLGMRWPIQ